MSATTGRGRRSDDGTPEETRKERVDRELIELLNELRVALPGVQFLFAFLLIVPFQQTAKDLTTFQLDVYYVALVAAAIASGLLIAPAAQHRVLFRSHEKEKLLKRGHRSAFAGLVVLAHRDRRGAAARRGPAVLPDAGVGHRGCGRPPAHLVVDRGSVLGQGTQPTGPAPGLRRRARLTGTGLRVA